MRLGASNYFVDNGASGDIMFTETMVGLHELVEKVIPVWPTDRTLRTKLLVDFQCNELRFTHAVISGLNIYTDEQV